ncbi:MAG: XdhC family protein [Candidatus Marinimicrobia bacterium]|nr:XdhC family protein [Candidatus Neomarinimicrobiota bacterium]MBL7108954.1 XdhC family protein [Candidatus Neomarinimicrobiota bacterium]
MDKVLLQNILNINSSQNSVICSQIAWEGSVPRKDYPTMLVMENGKTIGTIGGGKLEFRTIEQAKIALQNQQIFIKQFDLSGTEIDAEIGVCGGKTTILIEPFSKELKDFWESVELETHPLFVLTAIEMENEIRVERTRLDSCSEIHCEISKLYESALRKKQSMSFEKDGKIYLFQHIRGRPQLHIFGAGHIGKAVSELANWIEWDVKIYDDRKLLANSKRFPNALEIFYKRSNLKIAEDDFVLVASREHRQDYAILSEVLREDVKFIGLLSSRRKWKLIAEKLQKDGFSKSQIQTIHAPVGIDISSETVPEIAVSIMAEMIRHHGEKTT